AAQVRKGADVAAAFASQVQAQRLAIDVDFKIPRRTPANQPLHVRDPPTRELLDECLQLAFAGCSGAFLFFYCRIHSTLLNNGGSALSRLKARPADVGDRYTELLGQIRGIEIFAPGLDQALLVEFVNGHPRMPPRVAAGLGLVPAPGPAHVTPTHAPA